MTLDNPDRRNANRVPWRSSVELQPLDADLNPVGASVKAFSSDISRSGMGLIISEPLEHSYVRVIVPEAELTMYGTVTHVTGLSEDQEQYLVGVRFLS